MTPNQGYDYRYYMDEGFSALAWLFMAPIILVAAPVLLLVWGIGYIRVRYFR